MSENFFENQNQLAQLNRIEELIRDGELLLQHEAEYKAKYAADYTEEETIENALGMRRMALSLAELKDYANIRRKELAATTDSTQLNGHSYQPAEAIPEETKSEQLTIQENKTKYDHRGS